MTPASGLPAGSHAAFLLVSRVSHHATPPPTTLPPSVMPSHPRTFDGVWFWKMSGLPAAAPASAPPPAPRSMSITREGDVLVTAASRPAPSRPVAAPNPMPPYGVSAVVPLL